MMSYLWILLIGGLLAAHTKAQDDASLAEEAATEITEAETDAGTEEEPSTLSDPAATIGDVEDPTSPVDENGDAATPTGGETDSATKDEADAPTEAGADLTTDGQTDPSTDSDTDSPTAGDSDPPTEGAADVPTGQTDLPTEGDADSPTDGADNLPTEGQTDPPTEAGAELPTEKETDPPTDSDAAPEVPTDTDPTATETETLAGGAVETPTEEVTEAETSAGAAGATSIGDTNVEEAASTPALVPEVADTEEKPTSGVDPTTGNKENGAAVEPSQEEEPTGPAANEDASKSATEGDVTTETEGKQAEVATPDVAVIVPEVHTDVGFNLEDALDAGPAVVDPPHPGKSRSIGSEGVATGASEGEKPQAKEGGSGALAGILSAIVVSAVGAVSGYVLYQKKKLCFKNRQEADPEAAHKADAAEAQSDPQVLSTLLNSS